MQVTRLSVTPIKGLALHHPPRIEVTPTGAVGDRAFYLVDGSDRLFSVAKTGALFHLRADLDPASSVLTVRDSDGVLAQGPVATQAPHTANFFDFRFVHGHLAPGPWDDVFSHLAGRRLRLVKADLLNGGVDVEPLTLLGDASTRELARAAGVSAVDARRFRMTIDFDGAQPHEEDTWLGRQVRIGEVVLEIGGPVQRCAGTTRHPDSGQVDLKTLALIGSYRGRQESVFGLGFNFGVYARPVTSGVIGVGDRVEVLDATP